MVEEEAAIINIIILSTHDNHIVMVLQLLSYCFQLVLFLNKIRHIVAIMY